MIAVKIVSCSDPMMWYADLVGKNVPFVRYLLAENCILCREPAGYTNIVKIQDAEIIESLDQEIDFVESFD